MDVFQLMRKLGFALVAGADRIAMGEARTARLALEQGVSLEIPEKPIKEVDDLMRAHILEKREGLSEVEWLRLNGSRDQVCVRFGLTRDQIAGVLAGATRRTNGTTAPQPEPTPKSDPTPEPEEPVAADPGLPKITHNPDTWPLRKAKNGSDRPPRGKKEYESDETDMKIVKAVLRHGGADLYAQVRVQVAVTRRLTGQQVAELKARITRLRLL